MITKRILSLILDFLFAFIPAAVIFLTLKKSFSGMDFSLVFSMAYLIGSTFGILFSRGSTVGMLLSKIGPLNPKKSKAIFTKILFYHVVISICLIPALNHLSSFILFVLFILPLPIFKETVSTIDLLFKIRWDVREKAV